nr:endo-beta-1, 4-glucanase [uncultured bacterium]
MKYLYPILALSLLINACSSDDSGNNVTTYSSSSVIASSASTSAVDYTAGQEMLNLLGDGINLGNAWDSHEDWYDSTDSYEVIADTRLDDYWNNSIEDKYFQIIEDAGFNSIELPVNWDWTTSEAYPYTLSAEDVAGVREDIQIANSLGMPVIINVHDYEDLYSYPTTQAPDFYEIWDQIAEAFDDFSPDSLVFEVLNESDGNSDEVLNELIDSVYTIIESSGGNNALDTIMINPGEWGDFEAMDDLSDNALWAQDGNIIIDGEYYDPYSFTDQGENYSCGTEWTTGQTSEITADLESFISTAEDLFPGANGTSIPLFIGEFGASSACPQVSDSTEALYTDTVVKIANALGYEWSYWGFTGVEFDAYDESTDAWDPEILQALM